MRDGPRAGAVIAVPGGLCARRLIVATDMSIEREAELTIAFRECAQRPMGRDGVRGAHARDW